MRTRMLVRCFAAAVLVVGASQAYAVPMLRLTNGIDAPLIVTDNGIGDINPVEGAVTVAAFGLAGWAMSISTGVSKPQLGNVYRPYLDLGSLSVTSSGGGTLSIEFTDTDFFPVLDTARTVASIGGTTNGSISYRSFYDPSNTVFGRAGELPSLAFDPIGGIAFAGWVAGGLVSPTAYSLTLVLDIVHSAGGQATSFDAAIQVPEPATMSLVAAGLLALGLARRRRAGVAAPAASGCRT